MRKTKIICTMGPAVDSDEKIRELFAAGMDGARFNFSHGSHDEHKARIERVRRIAAERGQKVAIILDTKGPEIRVRDFKDGSVVLEEGQLFTLYNDSEAVGDKNGVAITYPYLAEDVKRGTQILIDDGLVSMTVEDIVNGDIICRVNNGGKIKDKKSINVPGTNVDQIFISESDRSDILFGIEMDVDYIAASFVRNKADMQKLHKLLSTHGGNSIKIIAKIENQSGVEHLDEILDIADGIMVARGDMGVEIPYEQLPSIQKSLIKTCYKRGKIVVTATQMLDSMQEHPRPTRAEVTDVANAIYDGTTAIMLSGETAAGKYPIEAVRVMSQIATYTEDKIDYEKRYSLSRLQLNKDILNTIATSAVEASFFLNVKAIVASTITGKTAIATSFYHPSAPIIACCTNEKVARQLKLNYGVYPIMVEEEKNTDVIKGKALSAALKSGIVKADDLIVLIMGSTTNGADTLVITHA